MHGAVRVGSGTLLHVARTELRCALEKDGSRIELELLIDLKMDIFIERGMRGGISMASNPLVDGYDPSKTKKYITYLDANNLYG